MRGFALALIILTDIIMWLTHDVELNPTGISFLLTLIVVVILAFGLSALLRNINSLKMTRNYIFSGVIGVIAGIFFYLWVKDNTVALIHWFEQYGFTILLGINILAALYIFFAKKKKPKPIEEGPSPA